MVPQEASADMSGYVTEVFVEGKWSRNAVVWPDKESADKAGWDLLGRWMVPTACRAVETDEEPNRPTWDEYVATAMMAAARWVERQHRKQGEAAKYDQSRHEVQVETETDQDSVS